MQRSAKFSWREFGETCLGSILRSFRHTVISCRATQRTDELALRAASHPETAVSENKARESMPRHKAVAFGLKVSRRRGCRTAGVEQVMGGIVTAAMRSFYT